MANLTLHLHKGMTLIELLVALLVLSIGLLGVAGLQTSNLRNSHSAHLRAQSVQLAAGILERIQSNRDLAQTGAFSLPRTCTVPNSGSSIQSVELSSWMTDMKASLGDDDSTCGEVLFDAATFTYQVKVIWDDSRSLGGRADATTQGALRVK